MSTLEALIEARAGVLTFYSPYHCLRSLPDSGSPWQLLRAQLLSFGNEGDTYCWSSNNGCYFLYADLPWDSVFFGRPMARLRTILFDSAINLQTACLDFAAHLAARGVRHCIADIPAEDIQLLQVLGQSGWVLAETRLQYVHENLRQLPPERYKVRQAVESEQDTLGHIAAKNPNPFDRFHADPFFSIKEANTFLGRYATAAVNGYCEEVLVPDEAGVPLDSFIAVNYQQRDAVSEANSIGRIMLMTVGVQNRGWGRKLLAEALHRAHERGVYAVFSTTQTTNRAIIHIKEKLGFRLGAVTHILSWSRP
ncbi:GNAT family N-acetyltransferase [Hymenobacter fodinae]|uniref:GNAT family N-acetyltransferase n=1 Tax=Hymenobacter fodinae TaxID=2510796 RepID=A0A4Z0P963_9BACT|nr:GNAT family N-acetyltransferase [Hymenobacter fodinae]TGE07936.1 GNAT family N-acetyltransferase [Hymenobacter fodinae]